jgi:hypothetical protein
VSGDPPYDVAVVTGDVDAANKLAKDKTKLGKTYRALGPYQSLKDEIDRTKVNAVALPICHEPDSDDCEPRIANDATTQFPLLKDITDVEVVMTLANGKTFNVHCGHHDSTDPAENPPADAIFIGMPAIDKFWIPYLQRVYGVDVARDRRRALIAKVKKAGNDVNQTF